VFANRGQGETAISRLVIIVRELPTLPQPINRRAKAAGAHDARLRLVIRGAVQGVGFRPFVYQLATHFKLNGWVNNSSAGVVIEVDGRRDVLQEFLRCLKIEKPPLSLIQNIESTWLGTAGFKNFEIRSSQESGTKTALVLPDIATCSECLREINDPANRRFRYPFTNCTHCGPRFSIIESIPYDRANTSMKSFTMCPQCQAEYDDPLDRRFHAQPNACPVCGPHLELWSSEGDPIFAGDAALRAAAAAIRRGKIVTLKGLGGFQFIVAAHNHDAISRLRQLKQRQEKPLALMFPNLESAKEACEISRLEEQLLRSPEAPIVLLKRRPNCRISENVAPGNPYLGVMLPCTPLHHLLTAELGFPVIATSGNLKDEPMAYRETDALDRLGGIADLFLVHNRPIVRHVDDSIVRVALGREMILRRARGYAPLPISLNTDSDAQKSANILAVGGHLKNAVAFSIGNDAFTSQHIGDLETEQAHHAFREIILNFEKLHEQKPDIIAADLHPDFPSTRFALEKSSAGRHTLVTVQHHIAHVLSCMAENQLAPPALGVAWDGTGWGEDGTIWGGEFFDVARDKIDRIAHFRPFKLPGGEKAIKEPRRSAAGLLFELYGHAGLEKYAPTLGFSPRDHSIILTMLSRGLNCPPCCSVGRLFDAMAALIGLRTVTEFEGQAAIALEFAIGEMKTTEAYPFRILEHASPMAVDWAPLVEAILWDRAHAATIQEMAARFHNSFAEIIVAVANRAGQSHVALSGGCFQNRFLLERTVARLREGGFQPHWHRLVPTNDGGIALGQIAAARRKLH
jgi:hydrogenase maturation protein HypF